MVTYPHIYKVWYCGILIPPYLQKNCILKPPHSHGMVSLSPHIYKVWLPHTK